MSASPDTAIEQAAGARPGRSGTGQPAEETLWRIVGATLREAAPRFRWLVGFFLAAGAGAIATELTVDSLGQRDAWTWLGIPSVGLGTAGAVLLGIAFILEAASQGMACAPALSFRLEIRSLHRMLLASPALFAAAALFEGCAVGVLLVRAVMHSLGLLLAAAVYLWFAVVAVRKVRETSRFLYRHASEQAEAASRARAEAVEARLVALQAQVHPHFLFNALNTVAALVASDPLAAERTVENLAGVLRRTLDRSRQTFGTVGEEIEYLESYLGIERERRGDRLAVVWEVPPEALPLEIPTLALQPLVENALKHGLGGRIEGGTLTVAARVEGGELRLAVSDDGAGLPRRLREGTGLGNLRRLLAALYGEAARLEIAARRDGPGTRAVVVLPARRRGPVADGAPAAGRPATVEA